MRCDLKLKCNGCLVAIAWLISNMEALGLRSLGMSVVFYMSQITVGLFVFSVAMIGWLLKRADEYNGNTKWLAKVGDCSYGIFYVLWLF